MEKTNPQEDALTLLNALGIKINELEEKQRLLKDRILLIGNNLISTKEEKTIENLALKQHILKLESDIKSIRQLNERIINELGNSARKSELEILKRQSAIFKPLEYVKVSDIKKLIAEELSLIKDKDIKKKNSII